MMNEELNLTREEFKDLKLEALYRATRIVVDGIVIKDRYELVLKKKRYSLYAGDTRENDA